MSDLILDSLEIKNFRLFKHLEIERLGRVNLIVGKNGVGKTALLEAIRIYAYRAFPEVINNILRNRNEVNFEIARSKTEAGRKLWYFALRHLFYGRPEILEEQSVFSIGPLEEISKTLSVKFEEVESDHPFGGGEPYLFIEMGGEGTQTSNYHLLEKDHYWKIHALHEEFVVAQGLDEEKIAAIWDEVVLTDMEDVVIDALRIVAPEFQRLNLIQSDSQRIPVVKVQYLPYPVPLHSLGEGMNRMLGIALALVNAKNGILLIDEIESGLHYSVQPDMWRLVFETAVKLNVQVFATTHSLDCIRAFESAASERGEDESLLISLRRHHDEPEKIVAVLADKSDLESIVRSHIEVR